jgi:hypothetical protein
MNAKAWLAGVTVAAALTITACSGSPSPDEPGEPGGDEPAVAEGDGTIDCAAIDGEKVAEYGLYVQLLAQLTTTDQLSSFTSIGYTPEKFDAALDNLEPVRSVGEGQFGNPAEALDFYRGLNDTVAELLAMGDAVTQADVDAYAAQAGGVDNVILKQLAINAPLSDACPDLDV